RGYGPRRAAANNRNAHGDSTGTGGPAGNPARRPPWSAGLRGGMRLGSKIFLTSALVIVVLAGVGVLSLLAVDRLVSVTQELERLAEYAQSEWEAMHLRAASAAFEAYRRVVAEEHALLRRGDRARAVRMTD